MSNYPTDIKNALFTLGFETTPPKTLQELNKRYHMLALKHHPDKNINDSETFKNINNAHKMVKEYFFEGDNNDATDEGIGGSSSGSTYNSIFGIFVKSLLFKLTKTKTKTNVSSRSCNEDNINSIIQTILNKGIQSAVLLFGNMDKQSCLSIYDILSANQELFSISREILKELHDIVESKMKNDTIINLNPSITDMLLDKVYILRENDRSFYIPLWHSQLHFKNAPVMSGENTDTPQPNDDDNIETGEQTSGQESELIVLCNPELPENVSIDENNNIYINDIDVDICELFKNQIIIISIDDTSKQRGFIYELRANDVCFRSDSRQRVRLHGSYGLACVNSQDIYNVTRRADVFAVIRLITKS